MTKYILKYWFEHGGTCLWSVNDNARKKFNYPVDNEMLPISKDFGTVRQILLLGHMNRSKIL